MSKELVDCADIGTLEQENRQVRARLKRVTMERDDLLADVVLCYRMLLSEPSDKVASFKAENILRKAISSVKANKS